MQLKLARLGRKVLYYAVLVLGLGLMSVPARAQQHEIGLTLGNVVSQGRTATEGTKLSLSSATALQANYAYRLGGARLASVSIGVHFLANGSRSISSANETLPRSVATLYVTPDVIVKFLPGGRVQPWGTIGGGYAQYESSKELLDDSANGAKTRIHRGALVYGGGIDVAIWSGLALRGEVRDFYTGSPSLNVPLPGGQHIVVAGGGFVLRFGH